MCSDPKGREQGRAPGDPARTHAPAGSVVESGQIPFLFIDIEATSLNDASVPIEVAWVEENDHGESHLIRPEPHWRDWSPKAEALHGISRQLLSAEGRPAADVARVMEAACRTRILVSDAPAFDAEWLRVLFRTAGLAAPKILAVQEAYAQALAPMLRRPVGVADEDPASTRARMAQEIVNRCQRQEEARNRTRHRALEDARGLRWIWSEIARRAVDGQRD